MCSIIITVYKNVLLALGNGGRIININSVVIWKKKTKIENIKYVYFPFTSH